MNNISSRLVRCLGLAAFGLIFGLVLRPDLSLAQAPSAFGSSPTAPSALGQPSVSQADLDWKAGTVSANGEAKPSLDAFDPGQTASLAVREALIQARKQLFDRVRTLSLDGSRLVSEFFAQDREAEFKVSGIIQNSQVLQSGSTPDGGAQVKVRVSLWGPLAEALIPRTLSFQGGSYVLRPEDQNRTQDRSQERTGLVVDARGTGAVPVLLPRVLDERGAEAYGPGFATRTCVAAQGLAAVFSDPAEASRSPRVGAIPLVVKALRSQGRLHGDLVLDQGTANAVRALAGKGGPLAECRAAFVYDIFDSAPEAVQGVGPGPGQGQMILPAPAGLEIPLPDPASQPRPSLNPAPASPVQALPGPRPVPGN